MAGEDLFEIIKLILYFAVVLFPAVYMLDAIRDRIETRTKGKEIMALFFISILLSLAVYPFLAALMQYTIALQTWADTGIPVQMNLLLFGSDMATYGIVLLGLCIVYLMLFNKAKEGR